VRFFVLRLLGAVVRFSLILRSPAGGNNAPYLASIGFDVCIDHRQLNTINDSDGEPAVLSVVFAIVPSLQRGRLEDPNCVWKSTL
jgi:hypothetical protein